MLGLVAMVVVTSFRAVGTLLVVAFLIAPAATAALLVRRTPIIMLTAIGFGSIAVLIGLLVSFLFVTATSATIAGLSVLGFFLVLGATSLVDFLIRLHHSAVPTSDVGFWRQPRLPATSHPTTSLPIGIPEGIGKDR